MGNLLYLRMGEEPAVPFRLHDYQELDGGRLHGPSTLTKLRLATLEVHVPGTAVYVPVAFHTVSELSIDRFKANNEDAPLAVKGEGKGKVRRGDRAQHAQVCACSTNDTCTFHSPFFVPFCLDHLTVPMFL
jgi:hypothetical protein